MNHTIRRATHADAVLLSEIGRRSFEDAFGRYNDPSDMQQYLNAAFSPDLIQKNLDDPDVVYLIASSLIGDVGYAKMVAGKETAHLTEGKQIQLERIYVLGDAVGTGAGRDLMLQCMDMAQTMQATHLWLGVWQENTRAISFYRKFGFKIIGEKQFTIGNTVNHDFVMSLNLRATDQHPSVQ